MPNKKQPRQENGQYWHNSDLIASIAQHDPDTLGSSDHLEDLDAYATDALIAIGGPVYATDVAPVLTAAALCGPDTYIAICRELSLTRHRPFAKQLGKWRHQHRRALYAAVNAAAPARPAPAHLHTPTEHDQWCMCGPLAQAPDLPAQRNAITTRRAGSLTSTASASSELSEGGDNLRSSR